MNLPEAFTPKIVTAFREGYGAAELRADLIAGARRAASWAAGLRRLKRAA